MRFDAHPAHQPLRPLAIHTQLDRHLAAAEERILEIQLVNFPHQAQVFRALRLQHVIVGRTCQSQQLTLPRDGQAVLGINCLAALVNRGVQPFF
jgi:hypothetical protein